MSLAGRFKALAIRRSSDVVDWSSPSLTNSTRPAAAGCPTQVAIKSTRLSSATRLRLLCTAPNGSGIPLEIHFIIDRKLPLTAGP